MFNIYAPKENITYISILRAGKYMEGKKLLREGVTN